MSNSEVNQTESSDSKDIGVCIVTETFYPVVGGGETQARLLAEGLKAAGIRVQLITRKTSESLESFETVNGIKIHRIPPVGKGQLKKWGLLLTSGPILVRLAKEYDLIFVSGFRIVGLSAVIVGKLLRKTVVLKADSLGEMSGDFFSNGLRNLGLTPKNPMFRGFLKLRNWIFRNADAFIAITDDMVSEFIQAGIPAAKVHLFSNSVDTNRYRPSTHVDRAHLRETLGVPVDAKVAVYTGRLVSYKGLPLLVKVWDEVRRIHPDAVLILVGTGGLDIHNCEDELRTVVAKQNLERSIVFAGSVNNVEDFLRASDYFVFPTEDDAFPSSLIEAMACGLPVVTTPVGAITSVIEHEKEGLIMAAGDASGLRDAICSLLENVELSSRLGSAGALRANENYSASAVNSRYIELFRSLLNSEWDTRSKLHQC